MSLYASRRARAALGSVEPGGGKVPVPDLSAAGRVAAGLQGLAGESEAGSPTPGEIYAVSQIEEAQRRLLTRHLLDRDPGALERALETVNAALGDRETGRLLALFGADFELGGSVQTALRELPVWMVTAENAAAAHVTRPLFAGPFRSNEALPPMLAAFEKGLAPGEAPAPGVESLLDLLRAPARAEPGSLDGQLRYVLNRWDETLGLDRQALLRGLDLLAEEAKPAWFGGGGGPIEAPSFSGLEEETERFSPDLDWMPSVVLLAKNVYVWLHQLSVAFDRVIDRLDGVPDEALDEIAARGFSGLWLIGVWERSDASRRLKQMSGNPEAVASAYSVRSYRIADDLGGEEALADLRRRCAERGVRLAADMVPNHMGIDSDWVLDEPQRFLSTPTSPFPAYTFTGPDLSPRPEVGLYVEDHYFDHSDAAVVFKRVDRRAGEERFLYHGNDGTTMPWNDTAQLDYLDPATREAVIRTILEVARRFPIIRFDAAMTLARQHYQRLWFPAPGTGGDIPSRAEHGLSPELFAERMPEEFWREVVDRVAAEAPDTLLLAEAFWLMEGYFVRTLGMHRVYNSAFMHMLRDQENGQYKRLLTDTLAFDPRILGRYVSFLTNPDERTAVDQFGEGDRYFGACVLLATLPGLPMLGHGQIEGYAEKYGMEYRRSYVEEPPNEDLVARHEREIFPLLLRRRHFAGVENFELYDFLADGGGVHDDVFVYSNGEGDERSLVVFNNSFATLSGTIGASAPHATRAGKTLAEALGLGGDVGAFWAFEDRISDSTFLRPAPAAASSGLRLEIPGFGYRVFEGFRSLLDDEASRYRRLEEKLAGQGVPDLGRALADLDLEPAMAELRALFASPAFERAASEAGVGASDAAHGTLTEAVRRVQDALPEWASEPAEEGDEVAARVSGLVELRRLTNRSTAPATPEIGVEVGSWLRSGTEVRVGLLGIEILAAVGCRSSPGIDLLERLSAGRLLAEALERLGAGPAKSWRAAAVASVALAASWAETPAVEVPDEEPDAPAAWIRQWTEDAEIRDLIGFHQAEGSDWVRKEHFEDLANWRLALGLAAAGRGAVAGALESGAFAAWLDAVGELKKRGLDAGYRVDLMRSVAGPRSAVAPSDPSPSGESSSEESSSGAPPAHPSMIDLDEPHSSTESE